MSSAPAARWNVDSRPIIGHTTGMSELPPADISPADWDATPASVRAVVLAMLTQLAALTTEVRDLHAQLNQHSQNSSKPPSSDPPSAPKRPARGKTGRK